MLYSKPSALVMGLDNKDLIATAESALTYDGRLFAESVFPELSNKERLAKLSELGIHQGYGGLAKLMGEYGEFPIGADEDKWKVWADNISGESDLLSEIQWAKRQCGGLAESYSADSEDRFDGDSEW